MRYNTQQVQTDAVERVQRNGREYLSFPIVPMREMVMNYPEYGTREYLPAENIRASARDWAGKPLTFKHPPNRGAGQTARSPDSYTDEVFGQFHDPEILDGDRLRGRGLIDVDKANAFGGVAQTVVEKLNAGEEVAVSASYGTEGDVPSSGEHDGESYDLVQGDLDPDHIAVFPPGEHTARCSPEDGCAAPRVNAVRLDENTMGATNDPPDPGTIRRVLNFVSRDDEHVNAHDADECGCGGTCDECSVTTNAEEDGPDPQPDEDPDRDDEDGDGNDGGGDADGDGNSTDEHTTTSTMDEDDIELTGRAAELAEQTALDPAVLADMSDEQLSSISPAAQEDDDGGDGDGDGDNPDENPDEDTPPDDGGEPEPGGVDAAGIDDEQVEKIAEIVDQRVEARLEAEQTSTQAEHDAEVVANATDLDKEALETMDPDKLSAMASEHASAGAERQVSNYAGVPGSVDRANYDDSDEVDTSDVSAGSFSDWQKRNEGEN